MPLHRIYPARFSSQKPAKIKFTEMNFFFPLNGINLGSLVRKSCWESEAKRLFISVQSWQEYKSNFVMTRVIRDEFEWLRLRVLEESCFMVDFFDSLGIKRPQRGESYGIRIEFSPFKITSFLINKLIPYSVIIKIGLNMYEPSIRKFRYENFEFTHRVDQKIRHEIVHAYMQFKFSDQESNGKTTIYMVPEWVYEGLAFYLSETFEEPMFFCLQFGRSLSDEIDEEFWTQKYNNKTFHTLKHVAAGWIFKFLQDNICRVFAFSIDDLIFKILEERKDVSLSLKELCGEEDFDLKELKQTSVDYIRRLEDLYVHCKIPA